jgi:putative transposase
MSDELDLVGLVVRSYPMQEQEEIIKQNIGNARFVWNNLLDAQNQMEALFQGTEYVPQPNYITFNRYLNIMKETYSFLEESESSSLQQVCRDPGKAYRKNRKEKRVGKPKYKSKKNPKDACRIQQNNNTKIQKNTVKIPTIDEKIHYRTSKEYEKLLKENKINHVTLKYHNGIYSASFNTKIPKDIYKKTNENVGIDLGMKTLATLSTGLKIANVDLTYAESMIKKYQKQMSRRKPGSNRYHKSQKRYWNWVNTKNNKIRDAYHKLTHFLVKKYDLICMEDLNIEGMRKNGKLSAKLQRIAWGKILRLIKDKCKRHGKALHSSNQLIDPIQFHHIHQEILLKIYLQIRPSE